MNIENRLNRVLPYNESNTYFDLNSNREDMRYVLFKEIVDELYSNMI